MQSFPSTKDRPSQEDETNVVYNIIVQIARGATLVKLGEHSTLDERNIIMRNVELCKSGPNIASHA